MCILLATTSHPSYSLILLFNRDELLDRPTERARWRISPSSGSEYLCGLDSLYKGTWLGISRSGRVAALTTLLSGDDRCAANTASRGSILTSFLSSSACTSSWIENQKSREDSEMNLSGGCTLFVGNVKDGEFVVTGNRGPASAEMVTLRCGTHEDGVILVDGFSNSQYRDEWARVTLGKDLLRRMVMEEIARNEVRVHGASTSSFNSEKSDRKSEGTLIASLFSILSHDTTAVYDINDMSLRKIKESVYIPVFTWHDELLEQFHSFDPALEKRSQSLAAMEKLNRPISRGLQKNRNKTGGTVNQTVILVRKDGRVKFIERTLFNGGVRAPESERDVVYEFDIS